MVDTLESPIMNNLSSPGSSRPNDLSPGSPPWRWREWLREWLRRESERASFSLRTGLPLSGASPKTPRDTADQQEGLRAVIDKRPPIFHPAHPNTAEDTQ
jgi:hypothetical protein